ncbi:MAG: hypothetical protein WA857_21400 [Candidatus Acidiferrum sp.]
MATSIAVAANNAVASRIAAPADLAYATSVASPESTEAPSTTKDRRRNWIWGFLALIVAAQLYFVRELLAAFVLFAMAFVAIAIVVVAVYMLVRCGELAIARLAQTRQPARQIDSLAGSACKPA